MSKNTHVLRPIQRDHHMYVTVKRYGFALAPTEISPDWLNSVCVGSRKVRSPLTAVNERPTPLTHPIKKI